MRIVREKHPLQGQSLRVLGHQHRQGTFCLTLVLPEGGTSLIPAAWTDLGIPLGVVTSEKRTNPTLGSVAQLIHARGVVDALLRRLDSNRQSPAAEEASHATGASALNPAGAGETAGLGVSESRAASKAHCGPRTVDEEGCPSGAEEGCR